MSHGVFLTGVADEPAMGLDVLGKTSVARSHIGASPSLASTVMNECAAHTHI